MSCVKVMFLRCVVLSKYNIPVFVVHFTLSSKMKLQLGGKRISGSVDLHMLV